MTTEQLTTLFNSSDFYRTEKGETEDERFDREAAEIEESWAAAMNQEWKDTCDAEWLAMR